MTKLPPQNIEAEQAILGSILIEPDSIIKAADIIQSDDFYRQSHRLIYSACLDIYHNAPDELNLISLFEYLQNQKKAEDAGGLDYLTSLFQSTPTAANISSHANIVKKKAILRRINSWAAGIQSSIEGEGIEDIKKFLNELERKIVDFSQPLSEKKPADISSVLSSLQQRWKDERDGTKKFFLTDDKFDSVIPRYSPGHLWIIGGYTSAGKSTLLAQMIVDVCSEGAKAVVFSLEDAREDKAVKLLANLAYLGQTKLMIGDVEDSETARKLPEAINRLQAWKLNIYDDVYDVDEMRLKIKKHKLQNGVDIVCVDFIQNIGGEGDSLYDRISDAIVNLQKIAKELEVTMIVLSQVSNEAMRSNSEIIGLKGAGELAAAADIVLWLKRVKGAGNEKHLDCEVKKNRPYGKTGVIYLAFNEMWSKIIRRV